MNGLKEGDIVQVKPDCHWAACLVIVSRVCSWGIQGYTPIPPDGDPAYVRLPYEDFEPTGKTAVFTLESDA